MNKKGIIISMNIIIISAIGFLLLMILSIMFLGRIQKQFNPSKDVCTKYADFQNLGVRPQDMAMFKSDHWGWTCTNSLDDEGVYRCSKCSSFRPKTQSELDIDNCNSNPNNSTACDCDEGCNIKEDETTPYPKNKVQRCLDYFNTHSVYIMHQDERVKYGDIGSSYNLCIQAHPKTECEKGNPSYIKEIRNKLICKWNDGTVGNYTFLNIGNERPNCISKSTVICRLKSIQDYSCKELATHILLNEFYDKQENVWRQDVFNCKATSWCIDPRDTFKEKQCQA